jgi:glycosyltransferase involved in cell wall biosynthesis
LAITLLEAMSYGKCVIYSDIPENAEAADGVGIPFRNKDAENLAEKIKFALANPEYCHKLGAKARERVKTEYNWDKIVTQTEEVYHSLFR